MAEPFFEGPSFCSTYGTETWLKYFAAGAADQLIWTMNSVVYAYRHSRRILQLSNWPEVQHARPRALTDPLSEPIGQSWLSLAPILSRTTQQVKHTHLQEQCLFLTRLPIDVRVIIYKEVLHVPKELEIALHDHETIGPNGLRERNRRLRVLDKSSTWTEKHKLLCYGTLQTQQLPLLTTCRFIYSEAISILYSSNSFHFDYFGQQEKLYCFLSRMPAHRTRDLRALRLNYWTRDFPPTNILEIKDWNDMWNFFSTTLPQLQVFTLKVVIPLDPQTVFDRLCSVDTGWLEPIVLAPMPVKLQFKALVTKISPERDLDVEAIKREVVEAIPEASNEVVADASEQLARCCAAVLEDIKILFTSAATKK